MKKKILIIEDDTFLGDVLTQKLTNEGFEVSLSHDGKDGYEKMELIHPDLILLDIILPGMNGYEILDKKQKDLSLVNIPVIVVSNSGQPVEIKRALALGVKDYVVKAQFEPEEVLAKVKSLFDADVRLPSSISSLEQEINRKNGGDKTSLEGKKIVWVEDDQFLNDIIARKLSATKAVFLNASDGEEALKIISEEMPDIVMLDIILSGMDGFEVLSEIKNNPKTKHIPVIMLSNLGQPGDVAKGESLGASLFLIKATVTPNEIIDKIGEVLTKHSLSDREDSES